MASLAKAIALAHDLAADLKLRQALAVTEAFTSDGVPTIVVGTGSAGDPGCRIQVAPQDWPLAKDILGSTANIYSPTVIKLGVEANAEAGGADDDDINTWAQILPILGACIQRGARLEVYTSANTDSFDDADFVAANLQATFDASAIYGMIGNV